MRVIEDAWHRQELPVEGVAAIGNFDGVHVGQQAVLRELVRRARELSAPALVITFEPHPLQVLRPELAPPQLTTFAQKAALLAALELDALLVVDFDTELAATPAERFVEEFLHRRLAVREVHVGSEFAFGQDRGGDLGLLASMGAELGFAARGHREVQRDGGPVSSTRIRRAVAAGDVGQAGELLGRPYAITATVEAGAGRGRDLGWPTVNLDHDNDLLPADGVYATELVIAGRPGRYTSVTNVGTRPTFHSRGRRLAESHLLDFQEDLYGASVELAFRTRLRGERKFASVAELVEQIGRDVRATREYFEQLDCCEDRAGGQE